MLKQLLIISLLAVCQFTFSQDTWTFNPDPIEGKEKVLDLRFLNEKVAGETGFVRMSEDGNSFVKGDGTPIRFWAVSNGVVAKSPETGKWLAGLGVNLVRICSSKEASTLLNPKGKGADMMTPDPEAVDKAQKMTAELKKHGIYTMITPYWVAKGSDVTNWGIDGYTGKSGGTGLWGVLFFNEKLQTAYKNWMKVLLTSKNPYTGIPLAQDPAVAMILLQNEDSLFFWTVSAMKAPQKKLLGEKFFAWAENKYGSIDKAQEAWQGQKLKGDDVGNGVLDFYHIWEATQNSSSGKEKRINDQIRFWAETMHNFNTEMKRYLREDLGCKQLIIAENWKTADQARLLDAERWVYSANDVIAKNHYFGGIHKAARWNTRISKGDFFQSRSVLFKPRALPVNMKHIAGHPHMITESTWVNPNRYQSEGTFLTAAYMSLTGLDGHVWFASGDGYDNQVSRWGKWKVGYPMIAGTFPATSLMYRNEYVQESEPVVHEERRLDDILSRKKPLICEDSGFDVSRDSGSAEIDTEKLAVEPMAFLAGRVETVINGVPKKSTAIDLTKYIDNEKKIIRSVTGELTFDYGNGTCIIDTACAQGVSSFRKEKKTFQLTDISYHFENEGYATVLAVSMDRKPITKSEKILVQIGTTAWPTGWKTAPAQFTPKKSKEKLQGEKILNTGRGPWQIEKVSLAVSINSSMLTKATKVSPGGYALEEIETNIFTERMQSFISFKVPEDCMYVILEK